MLSSFGWRLRNSAWMLFAILGLGVFTWAGFLVIGLKARRRAWLLAALAWGVWAVVELLLAALGPKRGTAPLWQSTAVGLAFVAAWVGGTVHSALVRRAWLRWRASHPAWGSEPTAPNGPGAAGAVVIPVPEQLPVGFRIPGLGTVVEHPAHANGTFARVYRIQHDFDGSSVAGKVFHRHPDPRSDAANRSLRNEVALLRGLAHRNVVRTYLPVPLGADGTWILVSEWIDGATLEEYAYGEVRMSGEQVFATGAQLLDGIAYLEAVGVVHRDIKPANVMLDRDGIIKLIDFNLTRPVGRETTISGSVQYLPPDVLAHGPLVDPMVDRYALGALMFELVTGDHPYLAEFLVGRHPTLRSSPARPGELRPGIDADVSDFLTRAVMPSEADRFASAEQMRYQWWQLEPSIRSLSRVVGAL
ncbi:MAG: serine/threonine-protein kinase [Candidatus Nanopelagicales bacterium]